MPADGPRPARAWDDPAPTGPPSAPGTLSPAAAAAAAALTDSGAPPTTAPPLPPPGSNGGAAHHAAAAPTMPPPAPPMPAHAGPPPAPGATAVAAPAPPAPAPVPGTLPLPPERGNGHGLVPPPPAPPLSPDGAPATTELPASPRPARDPQRRSWAARRRARRVRARKVKRQIRHVEVWSILKLSLIFYLVMYLVVLVATVLLWNAAASTGLIDNVESFVEELFGFDTFQFEPAQMLRAAALIGLVLVVAGTAFNLLMAMLFNLISDLVGGIRVTVIEEETRRPVV